MASESTDALEAVAADGPLDARIPLETSGRPPASAPSPRARTLAHDLARPTAIFLVSRVITVASLAVTTLFTSRSLPGEIDLWDSKWFIRAALHGWPSQVAMTDGHVSSSTIAFFPVFPLTIRATAEVTGLGLLNAGILVTTLTGLTAMWGVWLLVRHVRDRTSADRATLLVALFPGSFVLSMVYSEGIVVTCVAFGLLALLRRQYLLAGVLGLVATGTTPTALAFEVSCLWCAWLALRNERDWRALWAPALAPLGAIAYEVFVWARTGNIDAWRLTEKGGWNSYPSLAYPIRIVVRFLRDPVATTKTADLLFVGIVVTVALCVLALRARLPAPVVVYAIVAAAFCAISEPVGLRPRFIFVAFPLVVALALRLHGRAYRVTACCSAVLLVALSVYSVTSYAIFP